MNPSPERIFIDQLVNHKWSSKGDSTLDNEQFNVYRQGDWQYDLIQKNSGYYPPDGVNIQITDKTFVRPGYLAPNGKPTDDISVPETTVYAFSMQVTGTHFQGQGHMNQARFIVLGDHAVSTPMMVDNASGKSLVMVVRLQTFSNHPLVMVNELIWSVQQKDSETLYDIQKWYCCGY